LTANQLNNFFRWMAVAKCHHTKKTICTRQMVFWWSSVCWDSKPYPADCE